MKRLFSKYSLQELKFACILILAFCLPLNKIIISGLIAFMLIMFLADLDKAKLKSLFGNKLFLTPLALYFMFIVGMVYTQNSKAGWFDLQVKLSLVLFPLMFFTIQKTKARQMNQIYIAFIAGCFLASVISLLHSALLTSASEKNFFFYKDFSYFMHPGYFSMYLNLALVFVTYFLLYGTIQSRIVKLLLSFLLVFFSLCIILLSSKIGILSLLLFLTYFFSCYYFQIRAIVIIPLLILFFLLFIAIFKYVPGNVNRIADFEKVFTMKIPNENIHESSILRIYIWKDAIELVKEEFLTGYGTGDVKDVLNKKYKSGHLNIAAELKLNAHNQFLQTFIAVGILGFLLLTANLLMPLLIFLKNNYFIGVSFVLLVFLNFLVESILETQAGMVFYSFFLSLFVNHYQKND